jgi:Mrp family chromosome partitioning ATPase/uncharacterized protein involved in exopolysaccharide biosynthesis
MQPPGLGIGLDDVYFTLFRHKRLLFITLIVALIAAGLVYSNKELTYTSRIQLLIRYVVSANDVDPKAASDSRVVDTAGGDNLLNSETTILRSLDLAKDIAVSLPEDTKAKLGGENLRVAGVINGGLHAWPEFNTDVINVTFTHTDPTVLQPVLNALIASYRKKHGSLYGLAFGQEVYQNELLTIREKLKGTEQTLKKLYTEAGVFDIKEAEADHAKRFETLNGDFLVMKAELDAYKARLGNISTSTNTLAATNVPAEIQEEYARILAGIKASKNLRAEALQKGLRAEHPQIEKIDTQIDAFKKEKQELEEKNPGLEIVAANPDGTDAAAEWAQIRTLETKVRLQEFILKELQKKGDSLKTLAPQIAEVERQRDQNMRKERYIVDRVERAMQTDFGGYSVGGIREVESPTPPGANAQKVFKSVAMVFVGILAFGMGIAVLIDFVLDRTVKRPAQARKKLQLPFMLAIPHTTWRGGLLPKLPGFKKKLQLPETTSATAAKKNGESNGLAISTDVAPWDSSHPLRQYTEGLRERLITYFEVNGMNHKPKLVGVTSCSSGSGVSTLATGLASALSKTGDGNVLLVDMNTGHGATHPFYKGKPGCGISDVLEPELRSDAQVEDNLFLASMSSPNVSKTAKVSNGDENGGHHAGKNGLLPTRLNKIMPRLKASDYDYIIFDMPPVSPTSATPRFASNMDMVLLVLESEKTSQQSAAQAIELLTEARANAAVVLNKCRQRVPAMLSHET